MKINARELIDFSDKRKEEIRSVQAEYLAALEAVLDAARTILHFDPTLQAAIAAVDALRGAK